MLAPERDDSVGGKNEQPPGPKKPHSPPRLTVHGRIDEITAAAGATGADGLAGSQLI